MQLCSRWPRTYRVYYANRKTWINVYNMQIVIDEVHRTTIGSFRRLEGHRNPHRSLGIITRFHLCNLRCSPDWHATSCSFHLVRRSLTYDRERERESERGGGRETPRICDFRWNVRDVLTSRGINRNYKPKIMHALCECRCYTWMTRNEMLKASDNLAIKWIFFRLRIFQIFFETCEGTQTLARSCKFTMFYIIFT